MPLKKLKPVTPGTRHRLAGTFLDLPTAKAGKGFVGTREKTGGRNNMGRMTLGDLGGGRKQKNRLFDF